MATLQKTPVNLRNLEASGEDGMADPTRGKSLPPTSRFEEDIEDTRSSNRRGPSATDHLARGLPRVGDALSGADRGNAISAVALGGLGTSAFDKPMQLSNGATGRSEINPFTQTKSGFLAGIGSSIKEIFSPESLTTMAVVGGAAIGVSAAFPPAAPFIVAAAGVVAAASALFGLYQTGKNLLNAAMADTPEARGTALYEAGRGTFTLGTSVIGSAAVLKLGGLGSKLLPAASEFLAAARGTLARILGRGASTLEVVGSEQVRVPPILRPAGNILESPVIDIDAVVTPIAEPPILAGHPRLHAGATKLLNNEAAPLGAIPPKLNEVPPVLTTAEAPTQSGIRTGTRARWSPQSVTVDSGNRVVSSPIDQLPVLPESALIRN